MPELRVQLLGEFRLTYSGELLTGFNSLRVQYLLAFLLLNRASPQSRRHLAFMFWPDSSESQALTNLRTLLHRLRAALPEDEDFLQTNTSTVQWQPTARFALDVAEFEGAAAMVNHTKS